MLNAYSCPACPLAFEVGIHDTLRQSSDTFVCLACGTMHRIPTPAGRLAPGARYPLQALPGPLRALSEDQVEAVVSTRRDGVWVSEKQLVTRRHLKVDRGAWRVVSPDAVTREFVLGMLDQHTEVVVLDGHPCGYCGQVGRLTWWLRSGARTECPLCGGELVHEYFTA